MTGPSTTTWTPQWSPGSARQPRRQQRPHQGLGVRLLQLRRRPLLQVVRFLVPQPERSLQTQQGPFQALRVLRAARAGAGARSARKGHSAQRQGPRTRLRTRGNNERGEPSAWEVRVGVSTEKSAFRGEAPPRRSNSSIHSNPWRDHGLQSTKAIGLVGLDERCSDGAAWGR